MASSHGNGEHEILTDYWREFNSIESSKDPDEEEELSKTPDEGEMEMTWLHNAGYGFVAAKLQDGKELSDNELEGLTSSLTRHQAEAVRKRIDIVTTTMRQKQKQVKMHVRDIFPNQDGHQPSTSPTSYQTLPPDHRPVRRVSPKNRDRSSFLRRGGYSMSGAYTAEVEHHASTEAIHGVEVLSINPRSTQSWRQGNPLEPIADSDISVAFRIEERDNQNLELKYDPLGVTRINDLGHDDMSRIRSLALIELTALYDRYNITFSRPKKKKKIKEHGVFGVPIYILLEQDRKKSPTARIPLIFQELIHFLERECLTVEGILRIPGAIARVKQMRHELEERFYSGTFSWREMMPHDVATLMKQFIRELPIPLLTYDYIDAFPQIKSIPNTLEQVKALNLLVLLLPMEHRDTLRVLLQFLRKIISHRHDNKMNLSNVAMIMAPNLFLAPSTRSKPHGIEQTELLKAQGISSIVEMLVDYQDKLWTVPPSLVKQMRYQNEADTNRKNRKMRFRGRKDKSDVYRKSAPSPEQVEIADGVIRVQAPQLTKHSTRMKLDDHTTAGDIVSKFRRTSGPYDRHEEGFSVRDRHIRHGQAQHMSFRNPDNAQFADDNASLFEMGGNIGERCLDPKTRMLDLLRVNPNAQWVIKVHHR